MFKLIKIIKNSNYYYNIEKELPILSFILLVISSAGGSLADFFRYLAKKKFLHYSKEASMFLSLEKLGESWENILSLMEKKSQSQKYSNFLRGLLTVHSTSYDIARYSYNFFVDTIKEIEYNVTRYSKTILGIIEVFLLLSILFSTIIIAYTIMIKSKLDVVINFMIYFILFISLLFLLIININRPIFIIKTSKKYYYLNFIILSYLIIFYLYFEIYNIILLMFLVSFIIYIIDLRKIYSIRHSLLEALHEISEKKRSGLSFQESIDLEKINQIDKLNRKTNDKLTSLTSDLIRTIYEYGAAAHNAVDYIYFFVKDATRIEKRLLKEGILISLMAIIIPGLLFYFNLNLVGSLNSFSQGFLLSKDAILKNVYYYYIILSIVTNMVLSKAFEGRFFSAWRILLSIFLVNYVYYN